MSGIKSSHSAKMNDPRQGGPTSSATETKLETSVTQVVGPEQEEQPFHVDYPGQDKVYRVRLEGWTGWAKLSELFYKYDQARIQDVKEDIDTLLTFAGLFSAVLTAFIIESYTDLKPQPDDTSSQILLQISMQLATLTIAGNSVNSTVPSFNIHSSSFTPSPSSVRVNTLWSLSLASSLITASLSILVKQWLREFMARDSQDPREQVKLRVYREEGIKGWRVFGIAAFLPLLLQVALLLFFIGLSEFLRELNPIVGWTTTGAILVWLIAFTFTIFAPLFSPQCPYKTPMLKQIFGILRLSFFRLLHSLDNSPNQSSITSRIFNRFRQWLVSSEKLEEDSVCQDYADIAVVLYSIDALRGEELYETALRCFQVYNGATGPIHYIAPFIKQLISSRYPNWGSTLKKASSPTRAWMPSFQSTDLYFKVCIDLLRDKSSVLWTAVTDNSCDDSFKSSYEFITAAVCHLWDHTRKNDNTKKTGITGKNGDSMKTGSTKNNHIKDVADGVIFTQLLRHNEHTATLVLLSLYRIMLMGGPVGNMKEYRARSFYSLYDHMKGDFPSGAVMNIINATQALIRVLWPPSDQPSNQWVTIVNKHIKMATNQLKADPIVLMSVFSELCLLTSKEDRDGQKYALQQLLEKLATIVAWKEMQSDHWNSLQPAFDTFKELGLLDKEMTTRMTQSYPKLALYIQ